jgi:uncharacterized protein with PIN domain
VSWPRGRQGTSRARAMKRRPAADDSLLFVGDDFQHTDIRAA